MYPSVKEVIAHDDYTLSLVFENGEHGSTRPEACTRFWLVPAYQGLE